MIDYMFRYFFRLCSILTRILEKFKSILLASTFRECGRGLSLRSFSSSFVAPENIIIGSHFSAGLFAFIDATQGLVTIGNNVSLNNNVFLGSSFSKINIGNNVLIGPNVVFRSADHVFESITSPIRVQGHISSSIVVEDDVLICANCVITKGVRIGRGSVIAAGSVVTKDIPPYSLAAGVPALVKKKRGE